MLLALTLAPLAVAARPTSHTVSQVVQADPEVVQRVLADLSHWPELWSLDASDDRSHVRGQVLYWSSGQQARASLELVEVQPLALRYELEWSQTPVVGLPLRPVDHLGHITLEPEGGGTEVTWTVHRVDRQDRAAALPQSLEAGLKTVLANLAEVAEQAPAEPVIPVSVEPRDAVLAWRGFHHRWTYNHRINRSGDWWTTPECSEGVCTAEQVHAAASGSGEDRATFAGYGTVLVGEGVVGWYGSIRLWVDGNEGETLSDRACVTLPEEVPDGPALLRGYDLDAVEAADSLWSLAVGVDRDGGEVCAEVSIRMDCRTPECGTAERLTTYSLDVPFVVATGPDLVAQTEQIVQHHSWKASSLRDEPDPANHALSIELRANPERPVAVGLSSFAVELDAAVHTRGLDLAVRPGPTTEAGVVPVALDLFYVQWGPVEIAPLTVAQFAHEGEATITADVVGLQVEAGCAVDGQTAGVLYWGGKGADASTPTAEHRATATFDTRCVPAE